MLETLAARQLSLEIDPRALGFDDTSQCRGTGLQQWIGQADAEKAARFGLGLCQPGFNLLVLGEPGCGRTSLLLATMHELAAKLSASDDLVLLYNFSVPEKPSVLYLPAGEGMALRIALDHYIRQLARTLPGLLNLPEQRAGVERFLDDQLLQLASAVSTKNVLLDDYLAALRRDTLDNLELFQANASHESDGVLDGLLNRYRANLLVDNREAQHAPVIYDDDPTLHSLFSGMEGTADNAGHIPDFLRLHAGNLLRADGGILMLHLRDILADSQNGSHILEKLHRFLRNGRVQIEEPGTGSGHNGVGCLLPALPVQVKVVLIATREEYYALQDEAEELAGFFRIKVDFVESFAADTESYRAIAGFVAACCERFRLKDFSAKAVACLLRAMQRRVEDQTRISANFGELQALILESAAAASARQSILIEHGDVEVAIAAQQARHDYPQRQMRDAIVEGDLLIRLHGREVGQINGLTHTDFGDASFGAPVCISARCYAGADGIINVDREVEMSGPNHDKGVFILQNWLSASFAALTPLCLTASLVFEQEYHGVEGDSASCAELFALLSALSGLPLPQGIAVTGAMNQHGEVMPVGGINDKIEGYFHVCRQAGLDGTQGVLIPARNRQHLMLNDEVIAAVKQGRFRICSFSHVLEGIEYLTGMPAGVADTEGHYRADSVMGRVQRTLEMYRRTAGDGMQPASYKRRKNRIG